MSKFIKESEIADEYTVCPYCMWKVGSNQLGCCGESRAHFADAYELVNGDVVFAYDVSVVKDEQ
jgi:hypothetical protein